MHRTAPGISEAVWRESRVIATRSCPSNARMSAGSPPAFGGLMASVWHNGRRPIFSSILAFFGALHGSAHAAWADTGASPSAPDSSHHRHLLPPGGVRR